MLVQVDVSVQNFVEGLLAAHVDHVVVFGVQVNDSEFSGLLSQSADSELLVLPPGLGKAVSVPLRVGLDWRDVQVPSQRAVPPE